MNVLLITSDQQHFDTIGAFNPKIQTPALDSLLEEGAYYSRTYCPNPTCTPTRASLITGQYPSQHGAWTLGTKLPETAWTIGETLSQNGYATALVGKAHFQPTTSTEEYPSLESMPLLQDLDFWRKFDETFYGFDHVELARNHTDEFWVGQHYALWMEEQGHMDWRRYFREPVGERSYTAVDCWDIPEEIHYNRWIAQRTGALLEEYKEKSQPFFLWASFFDPHPDYVVPDPWYSMYFDKDIDLPDFDAAEFDTMPPHFAKTQDPNGNFDEYRETGYGIHGMHSHETDRETLLHYKKVYYGMMSMLDKYIGKIIQQVEDLGLTEDTLILYTTDHGHFMGEHGLSAKGPFMYEDLIKIPFIVKGKGVKKGVHSPMQSLVDIVPSVLDALGLPIPNTVSGISQYPVWQGKVPAVREHILCEHHHEPTTINLRTYVDQRYKITIYQNRDYGEIFDLENDPKERTNLWDDTALRADLLLRYAHAELSKEFMWMPRISGA